MPAQHPPNWANLAQAGTHPAQTVLPDSTSAITVACPHALEIQQVHTPAAGRAPDGARHRAAVGDFVHAHFCSLPLKYVNRKRCKLKLKRSRARALILPRRSAVFFAETVRPISLEAMSWARPAMSSSIVACMAPYTSQAHGRKAQTLGSATAA